MERIQLYDAAGQPSGLLEIPNAIISTGNARERAPHPDPSRAAAGEYVTRTTRPLVERYVAASPAERDAMCAAAEAASAAESKAVVEAIEADAKARAAPVAPTAASDTTDTTIHSEG